MLKKYIYIALTIVLFVASNLDASQAQLMQKSANIELEAKSWKEHYEQKLLVAAGDGSLAIVESLVQRDDIDINVRDKNDNTALMWAIGQCHPASADILINAKADFTLKNKNNETAFLIALECREYSVAQKLMSLGANVNIVNQQGVTAFMYVAWHLFEKIEAGVFAIKLLARANNLYYRNNYGAESYRYFFYSHDPEIQQALEDYEKRRLFYAKHYVAPIIIESRQEMYPALAELVADYYTGGGLPAEEKKEAAGGHAGHGHGGGMAGF